MPDFYEQGRHAAHAALGLHKTAGIRDALRTLFTGRVPLYHGTSASRAKKILESGLKPQGAAGATEAFGVEGLGKLEEGLAFTSRSPLVAKGYGLGQGGAENLERLQNLSQRVAKRFGKESPLSGIEAGSPLHALTSGPLGGLPGGAKTVQMNVPRTALKRMEASGAELHSGGYDDMRDVLKQIHPRLESGAAMPHITDVPLRGGVGPQFMPKSPHYQGVTGSELKQHLRDVVTEPRAVAKDVLRSLTGVSHRPSTLMRQGAPVR